ncbi:MAG: hypothetical protein RIC35_22590 [Marinoscillum sp.]
MTIKYIAIIITLVELTSCVSDNRIHYEENGVDVYGFKNGNLTIGEWVYISSKGDTIKKERYNTNGVLVNKQIYAKDSGGSYLLIDQKYEFDSVIEEVAFYPNQKVKSRTITVDSVNFQKSFYPNGQLQVVGKIVDKLPVDSFWQYHENGQLQMFSPNAGNDSTYIFDSLGNFEMTQIFSEYELQSIDETEVDSNTLPVPPSGDSW